MFGWPAKRHFLPRTTRWEGVSNLSHVVLGFLAVGGLLEYISAHEDNCLSVVGAWLDVHGCVGDHPYLLAETNANAVDSGDHTHHTSKGDGGEGRCVSRGVHLSSVV